MLVDPRTPCIIGIGRRTWHPAEDLAPEPLAMWAEVARDAALDAHGGRRARQNPLRHLDAVHVAHCMSWTYDDGPKRLAERLHAPARHLQTSILAGTASQRMVNAAAERMLAGDSELALVVGGEALHTRRRLRAAGEEPAWSHRSPFADDPPLDLDEWFWPTEWSHDVIQPSLTFAVLDSARRAHRGTEPGAHLREEAEVLSRSSAVAARNPHAWFRRYRTAEDLTAVTADNRIVSSPYTKWMVAVMDVDMAAALLVATHAKADELGVPVERRVYLRSWGFGRDATHLAERPRLDCSPAMAAVLPDTLQRAGVHRDDLTHLDLYSCFASSVLFATDALGLDPLDPRGLTVTGGLPYHGGPSSNYTAHAIAEVVDRLRSHGDGAGLITGVGMHMTKHVAAVYANRPGPVTPPDEAAVQHRLDRTPPREVAAAGTGPATIAAYSVTHDRSGPPSTALAVVDLADGRRAYARSEDPGLLAALGEDEWVGRRVHLTPTGPDRSAFTA